ncbi:Glutathione S-transferase, domain-containing protein [Cladophialophora immunda]|nr:Glutathione S-transferase, domain-containing protein [Cladophialophora immunda]
MEEVYTLFYNDYSICSVMVRYTIALTRRLQGQQLSIEERPVNIQQGGQLTEYYLCEVNARGTVPVLLGPSSSKALKKPLTESVDITYFLAQRFPSLCPPHLSPQIQRLMAELHDINYFSLTYTHKPQRAADMENSVLKLLSDPTISPRWRQALEFKLEVVRATRAPALTKEAVAEQESKASSFLSQIDTLLAGAAAEGSGSPWIFGTADPTALDAHVVPFVARLMDVGRQGMLQDRVRAYAERAFDAEAWREAMQGRRTVHATYL